ncbi:MAG: MBL fold metallo-hydrolase, partial [Bacillota bacterium]
MLKLTFLGHSCFLLNSPTTSLILDPWLRDNPQCSIKPEDIEVNALLVTHGHFDHLGDAIEISKRTNAV